MTIREQALQQWNSCKQKLAKQKKWLDVYRDSASLSIKIDEFATPQEVQEFFAQHNKKIWWYFLGIFGWRWGNELDLTTIVSGAARRLLFIPQKKNLPFTLVCSIKQGDNQAYPPNPKIISWMEEMMKNNSNFLTLNKCSLIFPTPDSNYWASPGKILLE